jgi:hypothetical protein
MAALATDPLPPAAPRVLMMTARKSPAGLVDVNRARAGHRSPCGQFSIGEVRAVGCIRFRSPTRSAGCGIGVRRRLPNAVGPESPAADSWPVSFRAAPWPFDSAGLAASAHHPGAGAGRRDGHAAAAAVRRFAGGLASRAPPQTEPLPQPGRNSRPSLSPSPLPALRQAVSSVAGAAGRHPLPR